MILAVPYYGSRTFRGTQQGQAHRQRASRTWLRARESLDNCSAPDKGSTNRGARVRAGQTHRQHASRTRPRARGSWAWSGRRAAASTPARPRSPCTPPATAAPSCASSTARPPPPGNTQHALPPPNFAAQYQVSVSHTHAEYKHRRAAWGTQGQGNTVVVWPCMQQELTGSPISSRASQTGGRLPSVPATLSAAGNSSSGSHSSGEQSSTNPCHER